MTASRLIDHAPYRLRGVAFAMTLKQRRHRLLAILMLCLGAGLGSATAANTPPVSASAVAASSEDRKRVTVNPGESITTLIRRTLPNSPYRDDFLRKAFHQMNPDAYIAGSSFRLKKGAVMMVPSPSDLQRMALGNVAPPALASQTPAQVRPELERKTWVRFP